MLRSLDLLDAKLARLAHHGPFALRIALGAVFLAHAYAKAFVFTFPGTERFFEANGFSGWMTYPVFLAELVGGIALLLGFRVRLVALGLMPVMIGALKPHLGNGWMFTGTGGGWEYPAVILVALFAQATLGAGAHAIDRSETRLPTPRPDVPEHRIART